MTTPSTPTLDAPLALGDGDRTPMAVGILVAGAFLAFLAWSLISIQIEAYWSWRLAHDGVATTATVQDYRLERITCRSRRGTCHTSFFHMHKLSFEGRVEWLQLKDRRPVGTQVGVLYLPDDEAIAVVAGKGDGVLAIFLRRIHGRTFVFVLMWTKLVVLGVWSALSWLFGGRGSGETSRALADVAAEVAAGAVAE